MPAQGVFDHFLVAALEDVKGKERMGKKERARQRHDRDSVWQVNRRIRGHFAANVLLKICGEANPQISGLIGLG
jgi:hypothetical protein